VPRHGAAPGGQELLSPTAQPVVELGRVLELEQG